MSETAIGGLSDPELRYCGSRVIRGWVSGLQPSGILEFMLKGDNEQGRRWREALAHLPVALYDEHDGLVVDAEREAQRVQTLRDWMWDGLGDEWRQRVPRQARRAWAAMLTKRTWASCRAAMDVLRPLRGMHADVVYSVALAAAHATAVDHPSCNTDDAGGYVASKTALAVHQAEQAGYRVPLALVGAREAWRVRRDPDGLLKALAVVQQAWWVRRDPAGLLAELVVA